MVTHQACSCNKYLTLGHLQMYHVPLQVLIFIVVNTCLVHYTHDAKHKFTVWLVISLSAVVAVYCSVNVVDPVDRLSYFINLFSLVVDSLSTILAVRHESKHNGSFSD